MICTHITDTIALTFRDKVIARIVVESWTLWRGLHTIHGDGVVGEIDQLWGESWSSGEAYLPSMGMGLWVRLTSCGVKAGPLERSTYRPW